MAAVTLLAAGSQPASGTSTPLDVSAGSTLRLNVRAEAIDAEYVQIFLETAPSASGPWRVLFEQRWTQSDLPRTERVLPPAFDAFVRARWEALKRGAKLNATERELRESQGVFNDPKLVLGITGDRIP